MSSKIYIKEKYINNSNYGSWYCSTKHAHPPSCHYTTISCVMSIRPPARMEQLCSHWTDFHEILRFSMCIFERMHIVYVCVRACVRACACVQFIFTHFCCAVELYCTVWLTDTWRYVKWNGITCTLSLQHFVWTVLLQLVATKVKFILRTRSPIGVWVRGRLFVIGKIWELDRRANHSLTLIIPFLWYGLLLLLLLLLLS